MKLNSTRLFKPWIILPPKVLAALLLVLALIAVGLGVHMTFFATKGFESATATIARIEEQEDPTSTEPNAKTYTVYVTYTAGGQEYTEILDSYAPDYAVGKQIKVKYDPANPADVRSASLGFGLYMIGIGAAMAVGAVITFLKNRQQRQDVKEDRARESGSTEPQALFRPSRQLDEEREVYFLTDQGTAKGTCHIEDADRNVLYEALCDRFSLTGDSLYTFVDHEHGTRKQYSVGKTLTHSSNGLFVLDNHSSFPLDGRDIWKALHQNGIRIETGLDGLKWAYTLYRDEEPIARIVNTNRKVHEEDAGGVLAKVPFPGFFRIWTREKDLDAIFLTAFAIGRTDMTLYN